MSSIKLPRLRKIDPNKPKKKKILLLSDDLRMHSGIATMSREFVLGTCDRYDWVQLGAAIKHPDKGKVFDISEDARKETGVEDASVKIYPMDGYGDANILKQIINTEKPDAILHFTDPRFWQWLYQIEHEIRQTMPLMYYNIWDDLPYPTWNESFYESCDLLMNISRQTQNIVKNVLQKFPKPDWAVQWVPHGVNEKKFFPITPLTEGHDEYIKFKEEFQKTNDVDFVVFWNNRNIHRKHPGDVVLAFNNFCEMLPKEKADRCVLLMHTQPIDENGTDLYAVKSAVCPKYKVIFSDKPVDTKMMNFMYNIADVTINLASNEGFGISWCESLHAATPIISNVTGGLQDGCRFADDNGDWIEFTTDFPSNHAGTYTFHGRWAKPIFPSNRSLAGSPVTPFIFDDRADFNDAAAGIKWWYDIAPEDREVMGNAGREWILGDESNMSSRRMSVRFIECIDECLEKWTPRKKISMYRVKPQKINEKMGVL